jgi:hypothetical protein
MGTTCGGPSNPIRGAEQQHFTHGLGMSRLITLAQRGGFTL